MMLIPSWRSNNMAYDYKSELEKWMSERYLTTFDVTDLIEEIRKDRKTSDLSDVDDSMDGDFDSAMASAGHGTDEDYGYFGDPEICGE